MAVSAPTFRKKDDGQRAPLAPAVFQEPLTQSNQGIRSACLRGWRVPDAPHMVQLAQGHGQHRTHTHILCPLGTDGEVLLLMVNAGHGCFPTWGGSLAP